MYIRNHFLLLLFIATLICSCGRHRYLQAPDGVSKQDTLYQKSLEEYRVQSDDMLSIRVLTVNEKYAALFNPINNQTQAANASGPYLYLSSYVVDLEGNVEFPEIGKIHVSGHTIPEIERLVHAKVSETVYDNQIIVRLLSFRISIVGEVKSPGEYTVYRDQANILQVLALAGDMNYYGNRKEVMIYRTTEKGTIPYSIDLTKRDALSSSIFYLQPNDIVYVQPLPRTIFRVNVTDVITYLSAISSSLALVIAILSLTK